jgi:enoyl-CoA hydratase
MDFKNLLLETSNGIARLTVHRPDKLNALNHETLTELARAFDALESDSNVRCVVITGSGEKAFVAGADINELVAMPSAMAAKELAYFGQQVFGRLDRMTKPSIAMVNGFALGGGCELALACTLRTASKTARFGLPEVSLGIIPGYGGTQRLARIAGPGVAREWVLTGEMIGAEEAWRVALETIRRGLNMSQQEGEIIESDMFGLASTTDDMRQRMQAFLDKAKKK